MTTLAKRVVGKIVHSTLIQDLINYQELRDLAKVANDNYATNHLRELSSLSLSKIFADPVYETEWNHAASITRELELPEMMGGVNKGDQRAIFYLLSHFKPNKVLEIGTHIGCSTVQIALALKKNPASHLTTVDLMDVNDVTTKPWQKYNSKHSPSELMNLIGASSKVQFIKEDSRKFLKSCNQKFDFIFLDGSHKAAMVFQEIPLAMRLLNENGIILLHDYFPNNKPLWKNTSTIPGPYLAVQKITREEKNVTAIPLGRLPWETKLGSRFTSLAVLSRKVAIA